MVPLAECDRLVISPTEKASWARCEPPIARMTLPYFTMDLPGGSEVTMPDGQPLGPSVCAPCTAHAADEQLEQLSQQLQVPLPDPAGTMLRNSLTRGRKRGEIG